MALASGQTLCFAEATIDDTSESEPEQDSHYLLEAHPSRQCCWNVNKLLRSKTRLLRNPLIITILVLITMCVSLGAWIVYLSEGLRRVPGDHYDKLFNSLVAGGSSSIWDSEHQHFIREVNPVSVHSHNDYRRRIPLFEALGSGCTSIEADVHLRDSDLLVGHSTWQLNPNSNLRTMYLDPLERILRARNTNTTSSDRHSIFGRASHQTMVLLVDLKTEGTETLAILSLQLQPLRELGYLTHWNGTARNYCPLTVVATGNAPFSNENTYRDVFWDADLNDLVSEYDTVDHYLYNASNSYYASAQWSDSLSREIRTGSRGKIAMQIERAKARGLVARYWDTPAQPPNMRDLVWRTLIENDIGILNVDDMGIVRDRGKGWGSLTPWHGMA